MTEMTNPKDHGYRLSAQIGYLLRRANQRHLAIFNEHMIEGLTAQQFAVLIRLQQLAPISQNELGRQAALDQATINGVIQRLRARGLVQSVRSTKDQRRLNLSLTNSGRSILDKAIPVAQKITQLTCAPLSEDETATLMGLLSKIV